MAGKRKGSSTSPAKGGLIWAEKRPREHAQQITKRIPAEVNRMLDELDCPEELRDLVKSHVYTTLYREWSRRFEGK